MTSKNTDDKPEILDFRRFRLRDGDILAVRNRVADELDRERFMKMLERTVNKHVMVVFVDKLSDIRTMNVKQMLNLIGDDAIALEGYVKTTEVLRLAASDMRAAGWVRVVDDMAEEDAALLNAAGWKMHENN